MKNRIKIVLFILIIQIFLMGGGIMGEVEFWPDTIAEPLMKLDGVPVVDPISPVIPIPAPIVKPKPTPKPTPTIIPTPVVAPKPDNKQTIEVKGIKIKHTGVPKSYEEIKRLVEDKKITNVKLDADYGEYFTVIELIKLFDDNDVKYEPNPYTTRGTDYEEKE